MDKKGIKFAIPKGSLQTKTAKFLTTAGIHIEGYNEQIRTYRPQINVENVIVKVLRPQEIPLLIAKGYYDLGISGLDWFLESQVDSEAEVILDLGYGRVDIVVAVPDSWNDVNSISELLEIRKKEIRIYTEYLNMTSNLIVRKTGVEPTIFTPWKNVRRRGFSNVSVFLSFGATEAKPPEDAEAIIDNTETGSTLRANNLKIIGTLVKGSTARLIANIASLHHPEKSKIIENICGKLTQSLQESKS